MGFGCKRTGGIDMKDVEQIIKAQNIYFKRFQPQLLFLANSRDYRREFRSLLDIPQDEPAIVKLTTGSHHIETGNFQKVGKIYCPEMRVTGYTTNTYGQKLMQGLMYLEALNDLGYIKHFDDAIETLLYGFKMKKRNSLYLPQLMFATTGDIDSNATADGQIRIDTAATWAAARDAADGAGVDAAGGTVNVYGMKIGADYYVARLFLVFTAASLAIPAGATIGTGANTLKFTVTGITTAAVDNLHVVRSTKNNTTAVVNAEFDLLTGLPGGAITSCGSATGTVAAKTVTLNATGDAHITANADVHFAIIADNDQSNTTPTVDQRSSVGTGDNATAADRPKLNVTYTVPATGGFFNFF